MDCAVEVGLTELDSPLLVFCALRRGRSTAPWQSFGYMCQGGTHSVQVVREHQHKALA